VNHEQGGMFFLYGYGEIGKTFMWKTLCSALRSKGKIVLAVASSGIAFLYYQEVKQQILNSRFQFPH